MSKEEIRDMLEESIGYGLARDQKAGQTKKELYGDSEGRYESCRSRGGGRLRPWEMEKDDPLWRPLKGETERQRRSKEDKIKKYFCINLVHFVLVVNIERLEGKGISQLNFLSVSAYTKTRSESVYGSVGEQAKEKLSGVLINNPGYKTMVTVRTAFHHGNCLLNDY